MASCFDLIARLRLKSASARHAVQLLAFLNPFPSVQLLLLAQSVQLVQLEQLVHPVQFVQLEQLRQL